jgi:hypothetical protein
MNNFSALAFIVLTWGATNSYLNILNMMSIDKILKNNNIYVNKNDKIYIIGLCAYSFTLSLYVAHNHLY